MGTPPIDPPVNLLEHLAAMDFAHRLAAVRKQRGMTQQTLADTVGVHVTQLRRSKLAPTSPPSTSSARSPSPSRSRPTSSSSTPTNAAHKTNRSDSTWPLSTSSTQTNATASAPSSKVPSCATRPVGWHRPADYSSGAMYRAGMQAASHTSSLPS